MSFIGAEVNHLWPASVYSPSTDVGVAVVTLVRTSDPPCFSVMPIPARAPVLDPAGRIPYEVITGDGLVLALAVAALDRVLPDIWYPIDGYEQNRAWREPLDVWLTQVADHAARAVPIRHGLIGLGVSANPYDGDGVPDEREVSHLVPGRSGGAVRYPPTRWYTPW